MKNDRTPYFRPRKRFSLHNTPPAMKIFAVAALSLLAVVYTVGNLTPTDGQLFSSLFGNYNDELGVSEATETIEIEEGEPEPVNQILTEKVKRGESLYVILTSHGLSPADIAVISKELKGKFSVRSLRPGQQYQIEKTPDGRFLSFSLQESRARKLHMQKDEDSGSFQVWQEVLDYDVQLATLSGTINSTLALELQKNSRYSLITELQNLFAWKINFNRDIQPGTAYRVLFEEKWIGDEYITTGKILAAEINLEGQNYTAYRFTDSRGTTAYYDENGNSLSGFFLSQPCNYTRISSGYGYRIHPILRRRQFHSGVDYAAPTGTPVYAVADGKVVFRGRKGAAGKMVTVAHANGYHTKYLHLSRYATKAPYGSRVKQGDVIGYVGSTGRSTGPHLHFTIVRHGKLKNPLKELKAAGTRKRVSQSEMQSFMAQISVFRSQLDETGVMVADVTKYSEKNTTALN